MTTVYKFSPLFQNIFAPHSKFLFLFLLSCPLQWVFCLFYLNQSHVFSCLIEIFIDDEFLEIVSLHDMDLIVLLGWAYKVRCKATVKPLNI